MVWRFGTLKRHLYSLIALLVLFSIQVVSVPGQQSSARQPSRSTTGSSNTGDASSAAIPAIERSIAEALTVIQDNYVDGARLDYNTVFKSSIAGMLRSLDPHSNYFDRQEFDSFRTDQRSEYFGIGATIGDLRDGDTVNTYIRATFENAPAYKAGLRFGDRILEIDGKSMKGKPFFEVRDHLRGPRATVVKVTVEKLATGKPETVVITRDAVPQPSVPQAYMIQPGVGYIAVTGFNLTTGDEFLAAVKKLHSYGMNLLILDLRGNGGGLLNQAVRIANAFLSRGQVIVTQKGRIRGSSHVYYADNETPDQTPLVVLVNRGSASASEIVAGALQDHDRALIVGETSFGKGLVQIPFPLEYGSALLLTIAKYYTPSGRLIQRDYTSAGLYEYYSRGGGQEQRNQADNPTGPASRTDTGRLVYSGGGITPDEIVGPRVSSQTQQRLLDPIFGFALELVGGRIAGFEQYKVDRAITYGYDVKSSDFPVGDSLYRIFRQFVASRPDFKFSPSQLDREKVFIMSRLRYELSTAAYGATAAVQVFDADDPQIKRAIELLPRARDLARLSSSLKRPS